MDFITSTFVVAYEIVMTEFNSFQNLAVFSLMEFRRGLTS